MSRRNDYRAEPLAKVLNWSPRIFSFSNFLSVNECDHLIERATPGLARCSVGYGDSARHISDARTCFASNLSGSKDKIVKAIEERIARLTFFPASHAEMMHVIRYEVGQEFRPHHDFYNYVSPSIVGGQRIATFLMYLNEPEEGGTTEFPVLKLSVKPKKGSALLFFNTKLDEKSTERDTLHAGAPVIKGHKWVATKWLHNMPVTT